MIKLKIGIVDDHPGKITTIKSKLKYGNEYKTEDKRKKYEAFKLDPIEIKLKSDLEEIIEEIIESEIDAIIIDYNLSSQENVSYTGVTLAKEIENIREGFPIFILTSYEDDLYTKEIFNAYQVVDASNYFSDSLKKTEINIKIIEQILKYQKELEMWENELIELLPKRGESSQIDSRILELNTKLEKVIYKKGALPKISRVELLDSKLDQLINRMNEIIENGENDG